MKEEETSSSDEDDEVTHVDESDEGEDDSDEDEEEGEEVGVAAITAVEESEKNVVKSEGGKLDKTGLNEILVKLRRPITQAKVMLLKFFSIILDARHIGYANRKTCGSWVEIINFLAGYALEEIQISTAETRILSCCTKLCL